VKQISSPAGSYPLLLSPLRLGTLELRNRVLMGSLHTRLENEPDGIRKLAAFYAARARGGVGLIITGSVAPNRAGRVEEDGSVLDSGATLADHRPVVDAVHAHGAHILMQVLHAGLYAKHDDLVGPTSRPAAINRRPPRALTTTEVDATVEDFVRCAQLAERAGYDGVEVMGSEGYLITQFVSERTNDRTDRWGGSRENRFRFPLEIVRRIRARLGAGFAIVYRISATDLIEGGMDAGEIDALAQAIEASGADALNTGIGWHESTVPTIASSVPRAAFAFASARLKRAVRIPVIASNRINMPDTAEELLALGAADLVSLARPFLADPDFVAKAAAGRADEINTCIACNQACLDHIFTGRLASCLVNPKACHETEFDDAPAAHRRRIAVVGSGPAGLACATTAAERGHEVVLFEADNEIGGQLNLARRIPGKVREFGELLRFLRKRVEQAGVAVRTGIRADLGVLRSGGFDHVVVATGIRPRTPEIEGVDSPKVVGYLDVILGRVQVGHSVGIIGTGGIAHDVAQLLTAQHEGDAPLDHFLAEWGIDAAIATPGGLAPPQPTTSPRQVTLFQRAVGRTGARLGKTTGWIHRTELARRGVRTVTGCSYRRIDERGLHYSVGGEPRVCEADHVVLCTGQEPEQALAQQLRAAGVGFDAIGGARLASELDAKRAINEGTRLGHAL